MQISDTQSQTENQWPKQYINVQNAFNPFMENVSI